MSGVWWNDGNAHFVPAEMTETVLDGISVAVADLNGDQDIDLYFTTMTGNTLVLNAGGRKLNRRGITWEMRAPKLSGWRTSMAMETWMP